MKRALKGAAATAAGLLAAWVGWGLYVSWTTARVDYETVVTVDGVELRRYPELVLAETTAGTARAAFGRLFDYIRGENAGGASVSMTAPVRTRGERVAMTAPVRTRDAAGEVTMGFYLPASYTPASVPEPANPAVSLTVDPARTLAVRSFSWYATPARVERETAALRETLDAAGIEGVGDPFVLQYDDPWTPPFMRTNEVAVEVR